MDKNGLVPNKMYKSGEVIFREGDTADRMYYICSGKVQVSSMKNGETVILATLREGEIFGEMALVDSQQRSATVTALENTWVYTFRANHIQEKLKDADPIIHTIMRILVSTVRDLNDRLAKATTTPKT